MDEDAAQLKRQLSPELGNKFNFDDPEQLGAFFNLAQHHGYPTPLLDWTQSPYVAAFFAYRNQSSHPSGTVRLFVFDRIGWETNVNQDVHVSRVRPHFTILELGGAENPRMLPQKALSALTNIDDIEAYIEFHERRTNQKFLHVFDLPLAQRGEVLRELQSMGVEAASLFPGLDGSCESLKLKRFIM